MLQSWSRKANLPKTPPKTGPLGGFRFPSFLPILTEHAITSPRLSASISFQEFPTLGQVRRNRTQSISRPLESGCVVVSPWTISFAAPGEDQAVSFPFWSTLRKRDEPFLAGI